jgi:hypothetical protein
MTAALIAELRGLLEKATPGPWDVGHSGIQFFVNEPNGTLVNLEFGEGMTIHEVEANAHLIVAMHNRLPELLSALEALAKDAGRYAYLKQQCESDDCSHYLHQFLIGDSLDAAIDAARGERG